MDADSNLGASQGKKGGKFYWTSNHDDILVACLQELNMSTYWKVDTSFRNGYLTQLEKMIDQKLPGSGIKSVPHIESRVKTLKKHALAIADMLNNGSGFAWDDVQKQINCDKDVFKLWCQSHKDANGLRQKSFPHFEVLSEIYGKDRANGNDAIDPAGAEENIQNTVTSEDDPMASEGLDGMSFSNIQVEQTTPTSKINPNKRLKSSKEGLSSSLADMVVSLKSFCEMTSINMEKLATGLHINHETERGKKVVEELLAYEGLREDDAIKASTIIIGNAPYESILFVLQGESRRNWVQKHLENNALT